MYVCVSESVSVFVFMSATVVVYASVSASVSGLCLCLCVYVYVYIIITTINIIVLGSSRWIKIAAFPARFAIALLGSQWKVPGKQRLGLQRSILTAVLHSLLLRLRPTLYGALLHSLLCSVPRTS